MRPPAMAKTASLGVVEIEHAHARRLAAAARHRLEQARLRGAVCVERLVKVEMILRDVREDGDVEIDVVHAVQRERMA